MEKLFIVMDHFKKMGHHVDIVLREEMCVYCIELLINIIVLQYNYIIYLTTYRQNQTTDDERFKELRKEDNCHIIQEKLYDDLVIVQFAAVCDGVIVSNDRYKDVTSKIFELTIGKYSVIYCTINYAKCEIIQ